MRDRQIKKKNAPMWLHVHSPAVRARYRKQATAVEVGLPCQLFKVFKRLLKLIYVSMATGSQLTNGHLAYR